MKNNMRKRLNLWHSKQRSKWKNQILKKEYEDLKRKCNREVKSYEKKLANNAKKTLKFSMHMLTLKR